MAFLKEKITRRYIWKSVSAVGFYYHNIIRNTYKPNIINNYVVLQLWLFVNIIKLT